MFVTVIYCIWSFDLSITIYKIEEILPVFYFLFLAILYTYQVLWSYSSPTIPHLSFTPTEQTLLPKSSYVHLFLLFQIVYFLMNQPFTIIWNVVKNIIKSPTSSYSDARGISQRSSQYLTIYGVWVENLHTSLKAEGMLICPFKATFNIVMFWDFVIIVISMARDKTAIDNIFCLFSSVFNYMACGAFSLMRILACGHLTLVRCPVFPS